MIDQCFHLAVDARLALEPTRGDIAIASLGRATVIEQNASVPMGRTLCSSDGGAEVKTAVRRNEVWLRLSPSKELFSLVGGGSCLQAHRWNSVDKHREEGTFKWPAQARHRGFPEAVEA